jgi:hypothetical protein
VLGINLVWTAEAEGAIPAGLRVLDRTHVETPRGEEDLVLLANTDAWPKAVLMDADARTISLPLRSGCPHEGALCREYEPLAARRLPGDVALTSSNGRYAARFAPADRDRLLFLSATYRPEWQATSPRGALRIDPVANAFLGVTIPAGVDSVDLAFVPRLHMAMTWVSGVAFFGVLVAFCVLLRRASASTPAVPALAT